MDSSNGTNRIFLRFFIVYAVFLALGGIAVFGIVKEQFLTKDKVTADDLYKQQVLKPVRGSILACDGSPLAVSIPVYGLRWDSMVVADSTYKKSADSLAQSLSRLFRDKTAEQYRAEMDIARMKKNRYARICPREVDFGELEDIQNFPIFRLGQFKGGLIVIKGSERVNPYGTLANRTVGSINTLGEGAGIEHTYDFRLRGKEGLQTVHRALGDEWLPVNGMPSVPAVDGEDIRSTIDVRIQEAAETELRNQLAMSDVFEGGTAIVMDVATGAVRGIANMYKRKDGTFDETYNYAFGHATEPGSTLKLAALTAMIEDGYITLDTEVDGGNGEWHYGGIRITDTHRGGYGKMTALQAFEKSSNIAFAKMVTGCYENDPAAYISRLHNMKLIEKLNLDIGGEAYAYILSPEDAAWSKSSLASLGYGYALTVTPMHILMFYNAIANGGKMMRPYFIEDFERDGIPTEISGSSTVSGSICSSGTLAAVRKALRGVVENGTAKVCNDPRYAIAGKTGTARVAVNGRYEDEQGNRRYQASFAGYFPADDPKYSCIVVLYTGPTKGNFYGATWAAPVFKRIADKIYASHPEWNPPLYAHGITPPDSPSIASGLSGNGGMPVDYMPMSVRPSVKGRGWIKVEGGGKDVMYAVTDLEIENGIVPDVSGMGLKDALYLLENEGYKVTFTGSGRVASQTPLAGTAQERGQNVSLILN